MWWRGVFEMGSWRSSNLLGVGFLVCEGLGMEGYIYHVQLLRRPHLPVQCNSSMSGNRIEFLCS
jgi:hypothetical protein